MKRQHSIAHYDGVIIGVNAGIAQQTQRPLLLQLQL